MQIIIQLFISGISAGCIYGIISLAFTMIYNSTKIVNFSQGSLVMAGAMLGHLFLYRMKLPGLAAVILDIAILCVIGLVMKFTIYDFLRKKNAKDYHLVITILGYGIVIDQLFALFIGKQQYSVPALIGDGSSIYIKALGINMYPENLILIAVTVALIIVFWIFLNKTQLGLCIQAIGFNPDAARLSGLRTSMLISITFCLSCAVSALGGLLIAPIMGATSSMGASLGVKGFAATILGGMGNPFAGFVGGLMIGLIETFASYYISSTYSSVIAYLVLLLMLIVKPSGLWPEKGDR